MHIAIDGHTIGTQLAGNVTYASQITESLAAIDQQNDYTLYVTLPEAEEQYRDRWPNVHVHRLVMGGRVARQLFSFRGILNEHRPDIFFVQFNAPGRLPCKVVNTVHDLAFEHYPETFRWHEAFRMRVSIRRAAREAAHIITPSEASREDVVGTYRIPAEKITAIPLAASGDFRPDIEAEKIAAVKARYSLPDDFILGIGSVQPRKNLARLIEAYASLAIKGDLPPLILGGRLAWLYRDSVRAVERFGVGDKVKFIGFVPDEDLPRLYSAATVFVYPSFFEGFGLPPLEAMACGTPVITGDRTSLPEVVGDAGIMIDPYDVTAIAGAMERLLTDANLRSEMSARGIERAKTFSWEKTARETLKVFEQVMSA
ncbi:MAG TPA: glycosyltransferase family 1 protein [Pyrinomonadaceae bacterium]|jgi:glycosyltransferase involved in cell wall biosynthesis